MRSVKGGALSNCEGIFGVVCSMSWIYAKRLEMDF